MEVIGSQIDAIRVDGSRRQATRRGSRALPSAAPPSDTLAISLRDVGKCYRLYPSPIGKVLDALGIAAWLPWRKQRFETFWALRGLNLEVVRGQRLGIIGRNGAGKSTLLKMIAGSLAPTEGQRFVSGKLQALLELGTGFHPEFTGRQNIRAALSYQGVDSSKLPAKEAEIIDFTELEEFIDQPVRTYSSGMYSRLAFAAATVVDPDILIVDEVLGAGDAYFYGKCVDRMKRLTADRRTTVLFVSHDLPSVTKMCDRAIWVKRGRIVEDGDPLTVVHRYYKEVQEEEAVRLEAQSRGLSKQQVLSTWQTEIPRRLFRLVSPRGDSPARDHKIRHLRLLLDGAPLTSIDVGQPMDNSVQEASHLLASPGCTDWSEPQRDERGYYRWYRNCRSRFAHAPFELGGDVEPAGGGELVLEIDAVITAGDDVCVEAYVENAYQSIGRLQPGSGPQRFPIAWNKSVAAVEKAPTVAPASRTALRLRFASEDRADAAPVYVEQIRLVTRAGQELATLRLGETLPAGARLLGLAGWSRPEEMAGAVSRAVGIAAAGELPGIELSLPLDRAALLQEGRLLVRALASRDRKCQLLLAGENELVAIGEILPEAEPKWQEYTFDLDIATNLDDERSGAAGVRPRKSIVSWAMPDPRIEQVRFVDRHGRDVTGIEEGEDLIAEVHYFSADCVAEPAFAMTIYLLDGTNICHANTVLANAPISRIQGGGVVRFVFAPFYGGPAEYMVSASIFKHLDPGRNVQPPYYDQHDRAYRFRVWKKLGVALNLGLLNLPYVVEHVPASVEEVA